MKITKTAVILLALVLLTAATVQSDEKPAKKEISNTRTASCLVKITTDEAVLPLNEFAIDYLVRSTGVAGKAAREVLEISPAIASEIIEIEDVFGVVPLLGGYGGYGGGMMGGGMMGGGMMGGGYGGGMDLPADSTPGASGYGTSTTSRSTKRTTPTPAKTSPWPTTTRTPRPGSTGITTTAPARRPATPSRRPTPRTPPRSPTPRTPTVTNLLPSTAEQTILFRLLVDFSFSDTAEDIKPAAEEFMVALIENLRTALSEAFGEYRSKLDKQFHRASLETSQAERELVQMQDRLKTLRDATASPDLSRQSILSDIRNLRQILQSAEMKRASDRTIYEATVRRIAEEEKRRKQLVKDDPITRELLSLIDAHEKRLKETQKYYDEGNASFATVYDLKEKIIRSRIELAKRQEEVSNPPGGIVISSLNDELANLSTKMALAQQEIHSFEEQLRDTKVLFDKADDYELLSLKADIARQSLEETLLWRARLGRNNRSIQPPEVTVIGAE